jgi:hypothetical protein
MLLRDVFLDIAPFSPMKVSRRFGGTCRLHLQCEALLTTCFMLVSCLAYSLALKMEAICSSETSVNFQRTARCYIPEDRTLNNLRFENLISYLQVIC